MRTYYLRFRVYAIEIMAFQRNQCYYSRYMQVFYMRTKFVGPYLSHMSKAACTLVLKFEHIVALIKQLNLINRAQSYKMFMRLFRCLAPLT